MLAAVIDSILQYLEFRKKDLKKRMREKKLRMTRIYAQKSKKLTQRFGQQAVEGDGKKGSDKKGKKTDSTRSSQRRRSNSKPTFDARVHEPIFGTGDLESQQGSEAEEEESSGSSYDSDESEYETE